MKKDHSENLYCLGANMEEYTSISTVLILKETGKQDYKC